ncbi:hypothetical protein MNBD_UNCLBAC01-85 [hydrothermal vent metagenome]|uniref:Lipopolysaccharide assembly protein A domain-containing protein n=1 Tax=hydrothermal vent metagenome TaxID=652676 RepID=A0A3B1D767_9ZZZZ
MTKIDFFIGVGVFFIGVLLIVLFLLPTEGRRRKKKKQLRKEKEDQQKQKDWERIAKATERQKQVMHQEIGGIQKAKDDVDKELLLEKAKAKKLQEKLAQERDWQQREQVSGDKKTKEFKKLKEELIRVQEMFSQEHVEYLKLTGAVKELKFSNETLVGEKKVLDTENRILEGRVEGYRKEIAHLKKDVARLSKKQDDTTWITKAEYMRVSRLLKEKETELERVTRNG